MRVFLYKLYITCNRSQIFDSVRVQNISTEVENDEQFVRKPFTEVASFKRIAKKLMRKRIANQLHKEKRNTKELQKSCISLEIGKCCQKLADVHHHHSNIH